MSNEEASCLGGGVGGGGGKGKCHTTHQVREVRRYAAEQQACVNMMHTVCLLVRSHLAKIEKI